MKLTTNHSQSSYNIPIFVDADNNPMDYADGVRELRRLMGWKNVAHLAEHCGVSPRTVEGWEQGRMPSPAALKLMSLLLD